MDFQFTGKLRPYQERAVAEALKKDFGIVCAPCGSGKTVMACYIIAERHQPTIVIVHTKDLLNQWIERLCQYLGLQQDDIGVIGAGKFEIKPLTVATIQTCYRCQMEDVAYEFGQVIIDECHHIPARTFTDVIEYFDCWYMLGLSATPYRRDRLNKLIYLSVGDITAKVTTDDLQIDGTIVRPEIFIRETVFTFNYFSDEDYAPMLTALVTDGGRNGLIVTDVAQEARRRGNLCMILSDRKLHCEILSNMLDERDIASAVLTGDTPKAERQSIIEQANDGTLSVIIATSQLAGEGLDMPRLNRLFIVFPLSWKGRLVQYIGRALRKCDGKGTPKIYDYADTSIGVLSNQFWQRRAAYKEMGAVFGKEYAGAT